MRKYQEDSKNKKYQIILYIQAQNNKQLRYLDGYLKLKLS